MLGGVWDTPGNREERGWRGVRRVYKPPSAEEWSGLSLAFSSQPLRALLSVKNLHCDLAFPLSPILSPLLLAAVLAMSAMTLVPSPSARFVRSGPDPQELPPSFSTSPSTSTSISASVSASASTSTSVYEFGVERGIIPSATMLSAPVPVQALVQYPSIPFVPACARMVEFERLREELRRTEMVRERQVEMLHVLADEAMHELDAPQVRLVSFRCAFAVTDFGVLLVQRSNDSHCFHPYSAICLPHGP